MESEAEQLSMLMDDELADGAARRVLKAMGDNAQTRAAWRRYHLLRGAMRGENAPVADDGFAARVSAALAQEPTILAPRRRAQVWFKPVLGMALAASVSALAVVSVRERTSDLEPKLWSRDAGYGVAMYPQISPDQLHDYLVMHSEGVQMAGGGDTLLQARLVSGTGR